MTTSPLYLGIDVAKATLEVGSCERHLFQVPNTPAGHRDLIKRLQGQSVAGIVAEATGIYGDGIVRALAEAALPVAVVQPGRVRSYARSQGLLAKTDRIDAVIIAKFGEHSKPRQYQRPPQEQEHLRALADRRKQIVEDRVREQNRLEACRDAAIAKQLRASIRSLERKEKRLDRDIVQAIDADPATVAKRDILTAEFGVGTQVATILITRLPELGTINRQRAASLAGLAPYDCSSGEWKGRRRIVGGRADVRCALYLAALTAIRGNDTIRATYLKLIERGKDKKLALIACARKLLVRLNSLLAEAAKKPLHPALMTT